MPMTNGHVHAHTNGEHWIPVAGALISPCVSPRHAAGGVTSRASPLGSGLDLQVSAAQVRSRDNCVVVSTRTQSKKFSVIGMESQV